MTNGIVPQDGIVIVAHTKPSYLDEAMTLAKSIRHFSAFLPIALVTDLAVTLASVEKAGFSHVSHHDFTRWSGLEFKWHLDELTPFRRTSLFIDSDSICYDDLSTVFSAFADQEFVVFGRPLADCHWFLNAERTLNALRINSFPFFCGDWYLFQRTPRVLELFRTAREIAVAYDELDIARLHGMRNDEPVMALAMAQRGLQAIPNSARWILQMQSRNLSMLDIDYSESRSRAVVAGQPVTPKVIHFQTFRSAPIYFRERFLVHATSPWRSPYLANAVAFAQSALYRVARKVSRLKSSRGAKFKGLPSATAVGVTLPK